ncbi:hypothetical protein CHUAL_005162 [Chamberlinius hualienensis]
MESELSVRKKDPAQSPKKPEFRISDHLTTCIFACNEGSTKYANDESRNSEGAESYSKESTFTSSIFIDDECEHKDMTMIADEQIYTSLKDILKSDSEKRLIRPLVISCRSTAIETIKNAKILEPFNTVNAADVPKNLSNCLRHDEVAGLMTESQTRLRSKEYDEYLLLKWFEKLKPVENQNLHLSDSVHLHFTPPKKSAFNKLFCCFAKHASFLQLLRLNRMDREFCQWIYKEVYRLDFSDEIERSKQLEYLHGNLKYVIIKMYDDEDNSVKFVLLIAPAVCIKHQPGESWIGRTPHGTRIECQVFAVNHVFYDKLSKYLVIFDEMERNDKVTIGTYIALQLTSNLRRFCYVGILKGVETSL